MPWRTAPRLERAHTDASTTTPYSQDKFRLTPDDKTAPRLSDDTQPPAGPDVVLPPPVTAGSAGGKRRARVSEVSGLKVHWARFKRRIGDGTAPSTSSCIDMSSGTGHGSTLFRPKEVSDEADGGVDEVVVDRIWAEDIKSSCPSDHGGGSPEKSASQHHQGTGGTNTDRDSLALRMAESLWAIPFVFLRWCVSPSSVVTLIDGWKGDSGPAYNISFITSSLTPRRKITTARRSGSTAGRSPSGPVCSSSSTGSSAFRSFQDRSNCPTRYFI